MNALQLVNELLSRFSLSEVSSFSGATGADSTIALRRINLAIQQICGTHNFKWLHKTSRASIATVAGTSTYNLASDVEQLIGAKHEYQSGGSIQVVDRATLELYRPDRADTSQRGIPTHMCLFGKTASGTDWLWQVEVFPVPDSNFDVGPIYYYYTILPSDLSSTTDVPVIPSKFHWVIIELAETMWRKGPLRVGGDDRQVDLYTAADSAYRKGVEQMIAQDVVSGTEEAVWEPDDRAKL